jgi:hypothetical protein
MALRVSKSSSWAIKGNKIPTSKGGGRYRVVEKSRRTLDGVVFDSKTEMDRYAKLQLWERAGLIKNLKRQVKFHAYIRDKLFCTYTADHVYDEVTKDGLVRIVEEVKSRGTIRERDYVLRKKAVELYCEIEVREIVLE